MKFMCHFFVPGAAFGEVHVSLFVAGAAFGESVFMVGSFSDHARIFSDHGRIGRALEMTLQPFSANLSQILEGHFSWQAQYLVRLEGDICCSTHCK